MTKSGFLASVSEIESAGSANSENAFNLVKLSNSSDRDHFTNYGINTVDGNQFDKILLNSVNTSSNDYVAFEIYATTPAGGPSNQLKSNTVVVRNKIYLDYSSIVSVFTSRRLTVEDNNSELGV